MGVSLTSSFNRYVVRPDLKKLNSPQCEKLTSLFHWEIVKEELLKHPKFLRVLAWKNGHLGARKFERWLIFTFFFHCQFFHVILEQLWTFLSFHRDFLLVFKMRHSFVCFEECANSYEGVFLFVRHSFFKNEGMKFCFQLKFLRFHLYL